MITNKMYPTMLDVVSQSTKPGDPSVEIAEVLTMANPMLFDAVMVSANKREGHMTKMRASLPQASWLAYNKGIAASKGSIVHVIETYGKAGSRSQVDKEMLKDMEGAADYRTSEAMAHIEAVSQLLGSSLVYGDQNKIPESFTGLTPRYNSTSVKGFGEQIILPTVGAPTAGAKDCASIWLVGWGRNTVHLFSKNGNPGGITTNPMGNLQVNDKDNNPYFAEVIEYRAEIGMAVANYQYVSRIANISLAKLNDPDPTKRPDIVSLLRNARFKIKNINNCKPVFYAPREVVEALVAQLQDENQKRNLTLTFGEWQGMTDILKFLNIPIRECDYLEFNEDIVK